MEIKETAEYRDRDEEFRLRMLGEEHRIAFQHEKLDELCREVFIGIEKYGPSFAINDYLLFMTALDAHMTVEEEIYFPALHGLSANSAEEFAALVAEHDELRLGADDVRVCLNAKDRVGACLRLDRLARQISAHEKVEEELIARITVGPIAHLGHSMLD